MYPELSYIECHHTAGRGHSTLPLFSSISTTSWKVHRVRSWMITPLRDAYQEPQETEAGGVD